MAMTPAQAKQLGILITTARAKRGLSGRGLAEEVGLNFSWLFRLERGDYTDPSPDRLARLAEYLGIKMSRIDRITGGALSKRLPDMPIYFRTKLDLTPKQIAEVTRYIDELRRQA